MKIQLKKITPFIILFLILNSFCVYSQITISKFEKEVEQLVEKSVSYDSLSDFESHSKLSDYKKYIGQKVYLPLTKNRYTDIDPQTYRRFPDEVREFHPFLFKRNSETIVLDSTNTKKGLSKTFTSNIGNEEYRKLIIDSVKTNIYKPYFYYGFFNNYDIIYDFKFTNSDLVGDKYFVITDVLYGDKLKKMNF